MANHVASPVLTASLLAALAAALPAHTHAQDITQDEGRFSRQELIADARELTGIIEGTHPDPYQVIGGKIAYHRRFQQLLHAIPEEGLTKDEFIALLRPFIAAIGDAHTNVDLRHDLNGNQPGGIPLDFQAVDRSLVVNAVPDASYEDLLGAKLVAVQGVPFEEICRRLGELKPIENRSRALWHFTYSDLWFRPPLQELVPEWRDPTELSVELQLASGDTTETVFELPMDVSSMLRRETLVELPPADAAGLAFDFLDPDRKIAYLRVEHMQHYRESSETKVGLGLESMSEQGLAAIPSATELFRTLVTATKEADSEALIVDLRLNGGGDSLMNDILLYFLYGKEVARETRPNSIFRITQKVLDERKNVTLEEINRDRPFDLVVGDYDFSGDRTAGPLGQASSSEDAFEHTPTFLAEWTSGEFEAYHCPDLVLVLTTPHTFSAGFLMALRLRRAGAILVGTPPGQAPNFAASLVEWTLPSSGVQGWVSKGYALNDPDLDPTIRELPVQYPLTLEFLQACDFDPHAEVLYAMELVSELAW